MFPTLSIVVTRRKKLDLMKNHISFSIQRNGKRLRYLSEVILPARAYFTLPEAGYDAMKMFTNIILLREAHGERKCI